MYTANQASTWLFVGKQVAVSTQVYSPQIYVTYHRTDGATRVCVRCKPVCRRYPHGSVACDMCRTIHSVDAAKPMRCVGHSQAARFIQAACEGCAGALPAGWEVLGEFRVESDVPLRTDTHSVGLIVHALSLIHAARAGEGAVFTADPVLIKALLDEKARLRKQARFELLRAKALVSDEGATAIADVMGAFLLGDMRERLLHVQGLLTRFSAPESCVSS